MPRIDRFSCAVAGALWWAVATPAVANVVYKCTDAGGKTSYQSSPCAGEGAEMKLRRGPDAQAVEDAQARAAADKARAASVQLPAARPATSPGRPAGMTDKPAVDPAVDCAALDAQRARAYGTMHSARRISRQSTPRWNLDNADAVNTAQATIARVEARMAEAGCKISK